jgi:Nucleotidyltransferase of unknown function (DUF6036)
MRARASRARVIAFMRRLGGEAGARGRVYFTGGATAVLEGWRETTVDIDIQLEGDAEELLRLLPAVKDELQINVELAAPHHFLPELPGWRERSRYIDCVGAVHFFHYDPYAQALSKIERGHVQDVKDVETMFARGLVRGDELLRLFAAIEPELYRFPAVDARSLRRRVEAVVRAHAPAHG